MARLDTGRDYFESAQVVSPHMCVACKWVPSISQLIQACLSSARIQNIRGQRRKRERKKKKKNAAAYSTEYLSGATSGTCCMFPGRYCVYLEFITTALPGYSRISFIHLGSHLRHPRVLYLGRHISGRLYLYVYIIVLSCSNRRN